MLLPHRSSVPRPSVMIIFLSIASAKELDIEIGEYNVRIQNFHINRLFDKLHWKLINPSVCGSAVIRQGSDVSKSDKAPRIEMNAIF